MSFHLPLLLLLIAAATTLTSAEIRTTAVRSETQIHGLPAASRPPRTQRHRHPPQLRQARPVQTRLLPLDSRHVDPRGSTNIGTNQALLDSQSKKSSILTKFPKVKPLLIIIPRSLMPIIPFWPRFGFLCPDYCVLAGSWIYVLYKKRLTVFTSNIFGVTVLLLKQKLNLFCEAEDKSYIKRTGKAYDGIIKKRFDFICGSTKRISLPEAGVFARGCCVLLLGLFPLIVWPIAKSQASSPQTNEAIAIILFQLMPSF
ncbi:hypothetical protein Leryth_017118 [Lithospermum erythrorhizon]|nr:hypothetical protein Leryth_017118 [Lithospermum erythrorhizon]